MGKHDFFRRFFIAGPVVLLLTALSCAGAKPEAPAARQPDILVVTVDTLRADRLFPGGGRSGPAPTLEAVGRAGAVFLDATAHVPLTLPSHASIFTGRYPTSHGVHDNGGFVLPESVPTLASLLRGAGYQTAAFVSSYVLRGATGLAQGFDVYDDHFEGLGRSTLTLSQLERRGPEVAREAARWLAEAPRPFFLWVHFYDPHAPYDPPPAFAAKFPGRPYDAEVAASDFGVSMLLDALPPERRAGTIVIATGDHGEGLGEHGESEHGILLYDATLHVPLVMQGPGIPAGVTVRQQVRHVDLLPTIAELAGVKPPPQLDGVSLVPLLRGQMGVRPSSGTPSDPAPLSYAESRFGERHFGWSPIHSVRDGAWKYIDGPSPELYQLTADPVERDNQNAAHAGTAAGLARALGEVVARSHSPVSKPASADADVTERLRSLGYVSGRMSMGAGRAGRAGRENAGSEDPKAEIARYEKYVAAFNDGLARLDAGRTADAEAIFLRLAREFPLAFEAHQYLARALTARRAFPAAIAEFDLAITLSPREPVLYFDAARALADAAQFDRALDRTAEGRRLDALSFYGALTEGLVARAAGQDARAEQAFHEAIRMNSGLAIAHFELGRIAEARGDHETARAEYGRALEGDSTLVEARRALDRLAAAPR